MVKKASGPIEVKRPNERLINVPIISETPLNIHRLGKKLKQEFEDRDAGKPKVKKKGPRDYDAEFMDSLYFIDDKGFEIDMPKKITKIIRFGFPASGFKKAIVSACRQFDNLAMTEIRGRIFVLGQYVEIKGKPVMDKFWRRIGGKGPGTGTPDIGVRAVFPEWSATLRVKFNADIITTESVVNLVAAAGFSVGIGEDRPEKSGNTFGMWRIAN